MRCYEKILYHGTLASNVESILSEGLRPSGFGIVYMSPSPEIAKNFGECVLEVNVLGYKLSCFEDCVEWERFCWTDKPIPSDKIKVIDEWAKFLQRYL